MGLAPVNAFAVVSEKSTKIDAEHIYALEKDARHAAQNLRDYFHEDFIVIPVMIQETGSFY